MADLRTLDEHEIKELLHRQRDSLRSELRWRGTVIYDERSVATSQEIIDSLTDELARRRLRAAG